MRFYNIIITNATTGKPILGADGTPFGPWSSQANGANNPGALNVEFDLPVVTFDQPAGAGFLRIWNPGLQVMGQSSNFNPTSAGQPGANIQIYGGMSKGLPLANPAQQGLLLQSSIQQAYGNWQGIEQTLDFQIIGNFGSQFAPQNIILNWQVGQQLSAAVTLALQTAFPGFTITNLSTQSIVTPETQWSAYQTVGQLAQYVREVSAALVNQSSYTGLQISPVQNGFRLFDATSTAAPKQITFTDLIGQPTWLSIATMQFKTVMRADIQVGDFIKMPPTPTLNTPQSFSQYRDRATFQGTFQVIGVRHLGHYKQPPADSWCTVFDAALSTPTT